MGIGTFSADNGLHSLVVIRVGAMQNQHSSPPTKDSKPLKNEKDDRATTARAWKSSGTFLPDIKRDQGTHSPRGIIGEHWGSPAFGCCPFLPSLFLNLHPRYLNMSGANFFPGAHHFVASNNTFSEAKTVSGIMSKGIRQQPDGFGSKNPKQSTWPAFTIRVCDFAGKSHSKCDLD